MPLEVEIGRGPVIGWDVGGAHLKAAALDGNGRVVRVVQLPCPLWQGLEHLDRAIVDALAGLPAAGLHALTMTGEVADSFRDRAEGVNAILERFGGHVAAARTQVYAGWEGFLSPRHARHNTAAVASANWAASAELVAGRVRNALFVDIGSTTADIVPVSEGILAVRGYSDANRLACEELVYSGVVRTPVMALADRIPFDGEWVAPMAECFATTADVYRLTGELPEGVDQLPAADGGGKTVRDSARRLARMLGRDVESAPLSDWRHCARYLADLQLWKIRQACERVLSHVDRARGPLVGAGVGRFVVRKLAAQFGRRYRDFSSLVPAAAGCSAWASNCAPAVAVAMLARTQLRTRR
jgi:probable H4MPT-linked C1 transfer pathway protein